MAPINRKVWVDAHAGQSAALEKLREPLARAGLSVDLARADLNRDGRIDASEAWKRADAFDHDGNAQTVAATDAGGQESLAARALVAFAGVFETTPAAQQRFWNGQVLAFPAAYLEQVRAAKGDAAVGRLQAWAGLINEHQHDSESAKVELINEFFNAQLVYTPDVADYWQSPLESLTRGAGDCEDYAVAKFLSLRLLGLPADRVEVAVVRHATAGMHAVALVRDGAGAPLVLDNMEADALRAAGRPELTPLVSVNEQRTQALDAQWNGTGPRASPAQVSRFQSALDRSTSVLPLEG